MPASSRVASPVLQYMDNASLLQQAILDALTTYPYHVVLRGLPGEDRRASAEALIRALSGEERLSFTQVRIDSDQADREGEVTRYSRTHLPLPLHTDSSNSPQPHLIVAFLMVQADPGGGGQSVVVPVDDIVQRLDPETQAALRQTNFAFGRHDLPVLWQDNAGQSMRYYRAQIDSTDRNRGQASGHGELLDRLDRVLEELAEGREFTLDAGDLLLLNNHKALHARTGFAEDSARLMYRFRARDSVLMNTPASQRKEISLAKAARHSLETGNFDQARALYQACLKANPGNADAMLDLSALALRDGEPEAARSLIQRWARLQPLTSTGDQAGGKPRVNQTRAVDGCDYNIVPRSGGGFTTVFKGGHFVLGYLLDRRKVDLSIMQVQEGRAEEFDAFPTPDLLINTIACADRARSSLLALQEYLLRHPQVPVINRPEAVLRTTRDENYKRLNAIDGLRFPLTRRVPLDGSLDELKQTVLSGGMDFPLILRRAGRQTGRETYLCCDNRQLEDALSAMDGGGDAYAIEFVDCRHADGLYRKSRAFFIDGQVYPVAYLASDEWQIHSGDRYRIMEGNEALQQQEQRYLADPAAVVGKAAWDALANLGETLQLDFAGVDFTTTADGELFVFEANPAMRHNFDHAGAFPYTRPNLVRISRAFDYMAQKRIYEGGYRVSA